MQNDQNAAAKHHDEIQNEIDMLEKANKKLLKDHKNLQLKHEKVCLDLKHLKNEKEFL